MKALILINFVDRAHCSVRTLQKIESLFEQHRILFRVVKFTSLSDSKSAIGRAVAQGFDTLFIGGGDGTVHNIFNLAYKEGVTFGIIPLGTVNALANSLGLPRNPVDACKIALGGNVRRIDVGRVAGRLFTCFASVGFDASVVHTLNEQAKVRWEKLAFAIQGIRRLFHLSQIKPFDATISPWQKSVRGFSLIISNIRNYAGFNIFSDEPDDGKMEVVVFRRNKISDYIIGFTELLFPKNAALPAKTKRLFRTHFDHLKIRLGGKTFLQLDGEPIPLKSQSELTFEVIPRAAKFLAPPKA